MLTAKCTSAPLGKFSNGSTALSLWSRITVEAILVDGVVDALGEIGLEFDRGHRKAVEEQHEVETVLVRGRIAYLPHHPEPVGGIAGEDVGVHGQGRLELGQHNGLAQPDQFDAVAQHIEGAAIIELLADAIQQDDLGTCSVILGERLPGGWLRRLHPRSKIRRKHSTRPVVEGRITLRVEPAFRGKMAANLVLEAGLLVQVHAATTSRRGASASTSSRTSILPVTAAEIRADRRS